MKNIICPVSQHKIPAHLPRVTAFFTLSTVLIYASTGWLPILLILTIDFVARAANKSGLSVLFYLSTKTSSLLKLKSQPVDKAPKLFAARLGAIMFIAASLLHLSNFSSAAVIVTLIVGLLASLEWLFNFCVGCYIYYVFVFPFFAKKQN